MIHILLLVNESVMMTIDAPNFAKVIPDYGLLGLIITNSGSFYHFEICHYYLIFYASGPIFLPHSIYKLAALPKK